MSRVVYDVAQLLGCALIVAGVWQWSWPAALVVAGALLLALSLVDSGFFGRRG